jgi:hypothetical protein
VSLYVNPHEFVDVAFHIGHSLCNCQDLCWRQCRIVERRCIMKTEIRRESYCGEQKRSSMTKGNMVLTGWSADSNYSSYHVHSLGVFVNNSAAASIPRSCSIFLEHFTSPLLLPSHVGPVSAGGEPALGQWSKGRWFESRIGHLPYFVPNNQQLIRWCH